MILHENYLPVRCGRQQGTGYYFRPSIVIKGFEDSLKSDERMLEQLRLWQISDGGCIFFAF
jgi:hypothetical protein